MVAMSRLHHDFQWAINLLETARFSGANNKLSNIGICGEFVCMLWGHIIVNVKFNNDTILNKIVQI